MGPRRVDFTEFYAASRDDCLRAVVAITGDWATAEDIVAEAFARAWASWRRVGRHPAPRAWVVRTALNLGTSSWRRRRHEVPGSLDTLATAAGAPAWWTRRSWRPWRRCRSGSGRSSCCGSCWTWTPRLPHGHWASPPAPSPLTWRGPLPRCAASLRRAHLKGASND